MRDEAFIARQQVIREAVLGELYSARMRRLKLKSGSLGDSMPAIWMPEEVRFALDYLEDAGLIKRGPVHVRITAAGIDRFEQGD